MNDAERVVKHLEIIQGIINRLGHNSFLVKGWSLAVLAAGIFFISRNALQVDLIILIFLVPVIGFWVLDGYFIWQENLFVDVYNRVRQQETTDFSMEHTKNSENSYSASLLSTTLIIFYVFETLFILSFFTVLKIYY